MDIIQICFRRRRITNPKTRISWTGVQENKNTKRIPSRKFWIIYFILSKLKIVNVGSVIISLWVYIKNWEKKNRSPWRKNQTKIPMCMRTLHVHRVMSYHMVWRVKHDFATFWGLRSTQTCFGDHFDVFFCCFRIENAREMCLHKIPGFIRCSTPVWYDIIRQVFSRLVKSSTFETPPALLIRTLRKPPTHTWPRRACSRTCIHFKFNHVSTNRRHPPKEYYRGCTLFSVHSSADIAMHKRITLTLLMRTIIFRIQR